MDVCTMRYTWAALCIAVLAMSVSVKSEEAPNALVTYELTMDITNRIYNSSLLKSNSSDYAILYKQVTDMLNSIYGCATCKTHVFYGNVSAMSFSNQTGTVLVKASLVFQSNKTNADEIKGLFMNATAADKEINGLKVNPNFTQVSVKSEEAPNALVTYELTMDITNRIYNSSLLKSNSSDYAILYKQVTDMLNSIYGCATCKTHVFYGNVSAMTFSNQTGTVLVKASLVFQSNKTNADEIKGLFMNATAADKEINGLKVNPNFTQVSVKSEEAPNALVTYELTMDITNRIYNSSLLKSNSSDYAILYKQVTDMLNSIYGCATCKTHVFYVNVSAMTFSNQTGTVLVKASLVFQSNKTNADEIKGLFMNATAADKEINGLKVNPNFTQVIAPPSTPAPTVSSTSHTTKSPLLATTHYNTASSFNQSPIALTSILRYTVSFCLLYFLSYSF
ncbi:uncharacterized protein LOC108273325 [Ictalurus punctatus]|uniref:Mucin-1 n=1 Tax=Ictalurus punctatus TaxID=7998 RepID=A0A9F7TPQ1_ICTPU|nr:uncharacterized protein LOC108273325 [Ictalurus punctatus]